VAVRLVQETEFAQVVVYRERNSFLDKRGPCVAASKASEGFRIVVGQLKGA
jgi:hypothetical protein